MSFSYFSTVWQQIRQERVKAARRADGDSVKNYCLCPLPSFHWKRGFHTFMQLVISSSVCSDLVKIRNELFHEINRDFGVWSYCEAHFFSDTCFQMDGVSVYACLHRVRPTPTPAVHQTPMCPWRRIRRQCAERQNDRLRHSSTRPRLVSKLVILSSF